MLLLATITAFSVVAGAAKKSAPRDSLADYIERVQHVGAVHPASATSGSLWITGGLLTDLASDYKARQVGDVVIVRIVEQTLAEASGSVASQRTMEANSGISALAGRVNTAGIDQLFSPHSSSKLQGQGQTASKSRLQTSLAGRVVAVLPGGALVVQADRVVTMNNERQSIIVRGVARPGDVAPDDSIPSTSLGNLEIELKGKGVISESTRPPNFLVRLLLRIVGF
jgi:flagellar L-ring protein precursor FlgH